MAEKLPEEFGAALGRATSANLFMFAQLFETLIDKNIIGEDDLRKFLNAVEKAGWGEKKAGQGVKFGGQPVRWGLWITFAALWVAILTLQEGVPFAAMTESVLYPRPNSLRRRQRV